MTTTRGGRRRGPQQTPGHDRLSPVTENYLSSLYKNEEEGKRITPAHLAEYIRHLPEAEGLGTSLPSVLGMVRRMAREDLVEVLPTKEVRLTDTGRKAAGTIVRRHRLAECMVVSLFGMELRDACVEGHQLEHAISPNLERRIEETLNCPTASPFGRPIPGTDYVPPAAERLPLREAVPGKPYRVHWIPEVDTDLIAFLEEHGVVPEAEITVVELGEYRGVLVFRTAKGEGALGYQAAAEVMVRSL